MTLHDQIMVTKLLRGCISKIHCKVKSKLQKYVLIIDKRPPGLIAPLLIFWHLLGNPPKNTTKGRDLIFNEGIRLLNMADTSLDRFT